MFEYEGNEYSVEELQGFAQEKGVDYQQLVSQMTEAGMTEKKPTKEVEYSKDIDGMLDRQKKTESENKNIAREVAFDNLPGFGAGIGVGIYNVGSIIKDLITDKEERKETAQAVKNQINNIPPRLYNTFANQIPALAVDYSRRVFGEDITDILTSGDVAKPGKKIGDATDNFLKDKYKEIDKVNKYLIKDVGEGIVKGIKQGDASDFISGIVGANTQMVETIVPAMMTGGASLPFQIVAPMYTDYNKVKAERLYGKDIPGEQTALDKLIDNDEVEITTPLTLGLIASGFEYIGFKGITKFMLGNPASSKFISNLFLTSNKEGITELIQTGVEGTNTAFAEGKSGSEATQEFFKSVFSEKGFEAYLNGFVGSAGIGTAGNLVNRALRSDNASVKEVNSAINNIAELNLAKNSTRDSEVKQALEQEIEQKELDLKKYILEKRKLSEVLNDEQKASLINIINQKDNVRSKYASLKNKLENNEITKKEFGYTVRSLNNQNNKLTEQIETINETAKEQLLQTNLETAKEQGEKVGLKQDLFETKEKYAALFGKKGSKRYNEALTADGHISEDGSTYYVNMETARQAGAIGVGSHELLHRIIGDSYSKLGTEQRIKLNKNFLNNLGETDKQTVLNRLGKAYGLTGDKVFETEELFTVLSDAIVDGEIKFDESVFGKIANAFHGILNKFGYKKEFENARQTFNFIKDYSTNIKKGKLTKRAAEFEKQDPTTSKKGANSRSMLIDDINDLQQGATTKAEFQKSDIFNNVFKSVQPNGAVSNYIKSLQMSPEKTQETIDSVTDRLINFDPAAKRKDGTVIGPKGLGEFIMANVGFGKLDAAKKLFKKGEKAKRETSIDTEEAKELTNESTETKKQEPKGQKARVLKSLADININNKEAISSTARAEINSLIEQNPKNLEQSIKNIIDKEITKAVKAQMGKISNVKGKVVVSEEYKSFIALNYENIVKSLDVTTIKNNYKTLFELTQIGKEDKKTKREGKKDSNFRKGIYKIETNKAKFTKFFTEGGYTTLLARQKGLANQIAKGIVEDIVSNEIINNSSNIDAILKAEIQNLANQLNKQKNEVVGNYADQIKFSKTYEQDITQQVYKLTREVYKAKIITDVFNLETQKVKKGKYDPWVVRTVFEQWMKGNIYVNQDQAAVNALQKIPSKVIKENRGTALEQFIINLGVQAAKKFDGLVMLGETVMEGGIPDFFASIHGFALYAETKFGKARAGKTSINYVNYLTGEFKVNKVIEGNIDLVNEGVKRALKKGSIDLVKTLKDLGVDLVDSDTVVPLDAHLKVNKGGLSDATVMVTGKFIANLYTNKEYPVFLIEVAGGGLHYMEGDPFITELAKELGIPLLEGQFPLKTRILASSVKENKETIGYKYKLTAEPEISASMLKNKSPHTLTDIATFEVIMKSKAAARLKTQQEAKSKQTLGNAIKASRTVNKPKGITVLDFDDTLATSKSLIKYTQPDGTKGTLTPEQYASTYQDLQDLGYKFDFSEFNKVVDGKVAPLFQKALKLQGKFGPENMFVLTARPAESAPAIFAFIKANGLNIPLKNITGLANSTSEAKALWIAGKVSEGFNDFYFADDALQNVQAVKNMLDQFDVKSKVQQAKVKFSKTLNDKFNDQLENVTGIESFKRFETTKARKRGADKGKFRLFIPPSHEDFVGLLYNFMGKGEKGNAHRDFLEQALVRPLNRGYKEIDTAKQAVANDYKALNKQMPEVNKMLSKKTPDGDFTYQDAIRVYLWDKHGYKIPGLSDVDQAGLVEVVKADSMLQSYAETLNVISKQETYVDPGPNWETGNIRIDLVDATGRVGRTAYFAEFQENADIMFSEENLNKIEAAYGIAFREALEDMLHRIKTGVNRPKGSSAKPNIFMNWLNASVAGVMFLNVRSSLLQQMSNVNYLNFADNNIFAAGKAFANQPQYWKDFAMIFNSDMLKQRRGGLQTDINGAELAEAIKKARPGNLFDQVAIVVGKALRLGFLPTQIGDNIAIATGGAAYYRNRVNKYIKDGLSKKEAETKAFTDFQNITQSTQQSARPDMTSQQQASWIGKLVLNFLNTPSQYNRIIKKAGSDILNKRTTLPNTSLTQSNMSNASRILYYGAAQNLIFYSLQTALFAVMFGSDDENEDKRIEAYLTKKQRVIQGSIDTILRGSGIYGVAVSTLKNMAIKFLEQREKGYNKDESAVIMEMLNFSPVVGIKGRRIVNAEKTLNYNKKVMKEMETFDIDNPVWSAVTNYMQTITTVPTNKIYQKTINLRNAADNDYTVLQRLLFFTGYTTWSLNLGDTKKMQEIKESIKNKPKLRSARKARKARK